MATTTKKEALRAFIETYRSLPELWNVEHPQYRNRLKKVAAYDILIQKLKVVELDATRETVVNKNNNLRSTFRKELKKVNDSKKYSASGDDVYSPALWYFNDLLFLIDQEQLESSTLTLEEWDEDNNVHQSISDTGPSFAICSKKRKTTSDPAPVQDLHPATQISEEEDDEFKIMAKGYAVKLKKLSQEQLIFADRLITEALVDAQFGKLSRWSYIVNSDFSPKQPQFKD